MPFFQMTRLVLCWCLAMVAILAIVGHTGCNQRTVAPELTYDQSQVELLEREIKKLDWE